MLWRPREDLRLEAAEVISVRLGVTTSIDPGAKNPGVARGRPTFAPCSTCALAALAKDCPGGQCQRLRIVDGSMSEWTPTAVLFNDERLRRRKPKSVRLRHRLAGDLAVADIEAVTQMDVVLQSLAPTLVGKLQRKGQGSVLSAKVDVRATAPGILATQSCTTPSTTKVGLECVVGLDVSAQPPWSMAMSTNTEPCFIVFSIVRVMSFGAEAPARAPRRLRDQL